MSVWPFSLVLLPPVTVESLAPSPQLAPCRQCKILPWSSVLQTIHVHSACPLKTYSVPDPSLNTLSVLKSFVSCGTQNWTLNPDADEQVLYEKKSWVILSRSRGSSSSAELVCCPSCCAQLYLPAQQEPPLLRRAGTQLGTAQPRPVQSVWSRVSIGPFLSSQGPSEWPCCPAA